ncbi:MAG: hypothetical protein EPO51_10420 [Phenylobacterium sp.]|uniref:hypothetical protein n=1 Tax=Phenylobacterium sp. TaxID=1871053 RepID=UPI0012107F68|nr:hypothetical protein [Phenylobacterium sp.]TAJ72502.1 MAG: hypothetical protein EPO51_10420 [Phenylobacterium sp.]
MRFRLYGLGYLLGWPLVDLLDGEFEVAVARAEQMLSAHGDCEIVEIFEGNVLLDVVDRPMPRTHRGAETASLADG